MIIFVASISVLITYGVMSQVPFFKDVNEPVIVKTATPISATFDEVDKTIFGEDSINPTVKVTIGDDAIHKE